MSLLSNSYSKKYHILFPKNIIFYFEKMFMLDMNCKKIGLSIHNLC